MTTPPFPTTRKTILQSHTGPVHALTYSSPTLSSTYLLTGSTDRKIHLWNPSQSTPSPLSSPPAIVSKPVQTYTGHTYDVLDLACTTDNTRFASSGGDKAVFLWDVTRKECVRRFEGHGGRVNAVRFAGVGEAVLVSGSFDASVRCWDLRSNGWKPIMVLEEAGDSVSSVVVPEGAAEIVAGSVDGRVRGYDVRMGRVVSDVIGAAVTSLDLGKGGETVLVGGLDSRIRLMDRRDGLCLRVFEGEGFRNAEYRIRSALGMGDSVVISGSENGEIFVWDLVEGKVVSKLRQREKQGKTSKEDIVSAVVDCKSRKEWASAGGDGSVVVWGV